MAFILQGHRGARGLKLENTLPSFEIAIDVGATSIETDVHLTRDGVPVLIHDPQLPDSHSTLVSALSLTELRQRCHAAGTKPAAHDFPQQDAVVTPLAKRLAEQRGIDPFTPPTLTDFYALVSAYESEGTLVGKTPSQCQAAGQLNIDIELKRVPFHPEFIGDRFDGNKPGLLEQRVIECVRAAGMVARTTVRSFDHRCVRIVRQMEPGVTGGVLVAWTAFEDPVQVVRAADAQLYCPEFESLDQTVIRGLQSEGICVLPWTVNDPSDWKRLRDWGIDGMTTDYPDRLAKFISG